MCMSSAPQDNSAALARQQEEERQRRVREGTAKIDEAFAGFTPEYYEGVSKAHDGFYMPQLDRQYKAARDKLTYSLADSGGLDSTAGGKRYGDLTADYGMQRQNIADRGIAAQQDLRGSVEQNRGELVRQLETGSSIESVAGRAASDAKLKSAPQPYSPLGDLFAQWTGTAANNVALQREGYQGMRMPGAAVSSGKSSVKTIN